jgi:hypothetical protein
MKQNKNLIWIIKLTRKLFNIIGGSILLIVIFHTLYPFVVGGSEMEKFCSSVVPGEAKKELIKRAKTAHYSIREPNLNGVDRVLVVDSRAMGRFICDITLEENRVATSTYIFND